jgi:hypothetical protein
MARLLLLATKVPSALGSRNIFWFCWIFNKVRPAKERCSVHNLPSKECMSYILKTIRRSEMAFRLLELPKKSE